MAHPRILDQNGNELPDMDTIRTMEKLATAFHGASFTDTDLARWSPSLQSDDGGLIREKNTLDARSLDTVRNDGYIAGARQIHVDNIVGEYFRLVAKPNFQYLATLDKRFDEVWADEFKEAAEVAFTNYVESEEYWIDASQKRSFTELVRTAYLSYFDTGEALATAEWIDAGGPNKTAIQMINPVRLSTPQGQMDGPMLRGGVQLNKRGAPIGYHIREALPDVMQTMRSRAYKWRYIPRRKRWGRLQVIHIMDADRPEMNRAVSKLVAVLETIPSCKKFRKIQLQRAVLNSLYAATLESDLPSEAAFHTIGVSTTKNGVAVQEDVPYMNYYLNEVLKYTKASGAMKMDGVRIPHLPPGTKLKLNAANGVDAVGSEFEKSLLNYTATALGLSRERFMRDFSETNYSSARFGDLDSWKMFMVKRKFVPGKFGSHVYSLFLEEEMDLRRLPMPAGTRISFWDAKAAFSSCEFIGSGRGQIDEVKETQAAIMRIASGLSTFEKEYARMGADYRDMFRQRMKEMQLHKDMGLPFPTLGSGNANAAAQEDESEDERPTKKDDDAQAFGELPVTLGMNNV